MKTVKVCLIIITAILLAGSIFWSYSALHVYRAQEEATKEASCEEEYSSETAVEDTRLENVREQARRIRMRDKYGDLAAAQYKLTMLGRKEISLASPEMLCALHQDEQSRFVEIANRNEAERCEQVLEDRATSRWLQAVSKAHSLREEESLTATWDREMKQLSNPLFGAFEKANGSNVEKYLKSCRSAIATQGR